MQLQRLQTMRHRRGRLAEGLRHPAAAVGRLRRGRYRHAAADGEASPHHLWRADPMIGERPYKRALSASCGQQRGGGHLRGRCERAIAARPLLGRVINVDDLPEEVEQRWSARGQGRL